MELPIPTPSTTNTETLTPEEIEPVVPVCEGNQTLDIDSNNCVCDEFSVPFENTCFRCLPGSFREQNVCSPCPLYCLSCTSGQDCSECEPNLFFDPASAQCIPQQVSCATNQIISPITGLCECDNQSISISPSECFTCVDGSYK